MLQLSNGGSHASVTEGSFGSEAATLRFRTGLGAEITCVQLACSWSGSASFFLFCEQFTFIAGIEQTQLIVVAMVPIVIRVSQDKSSADDTQPCTVSDPRLGLACGTND